ncbi:MAG TPA: tetratricopeptide repeat protein [Bryobacteraceae bacterium]|nr:tetratricopeptide repeat protein [Bryobacteraceae bacterium]
MPCKLTICCIALPLLLSAQQTDPLAAAKAHLANNRLGDAEAELKQYLALHETSAETHFLLGYTLFRETKARESLAEYTAGAKYQKPNAENLRVVAADYVLLSDYGDADKWFTLATKWEPQNVLGWYYLGRTKYNENRFEEAVAAFERCLELDPRHVKAEDNLGLCLQALGRHDEAEQAFLRSIQWQSEAAAKDPWPFIDLGSFYLEINQGAKAIPYLQQAVTLSPDSVKAHQQLGKAYLSLQQLDKAQPELEKAVQLSPDNAPAHYVLGQLYAKRGNSAKAKEEFALYSQLNAHHPAEADREFHAPAQN